MSSSTSVSEDSSHGNRSSTVEVESSELFLSDSAATLTLSHVRAYSSSVDRDTHLTVEGSIAPIDDESTSIVLEVSLMRAGSVADSLSIRTLDSGSISLSTILSNGSHDVKVG